MITSSFVRFTCFSCCFPMVSTSLQLLLPIASCFGCLSPIMYFSFSCCSTISCASAAEFEIVPQTCITFKRHVCISSSLRLNISSKWDPICNVAIPFDVNHLQEHVEEQTERSQQQYWQLENKLKEQSDQLEAKMKEHSEKLFQEAVRQLSECNKVYTVCCTIRR